MGYCGLKIPGHSGTDFKHKKAFTESNKILNHKSIFNNVSIEQREKDPPFHWFVFLKVAISIVVIFMMLMLISVLAYRIDRLSIHKTHLSTEYLFAVEQSQNKEAAEMLYKSAKLYLKSGALNYAQDEITLVLKLYPTNIEAMDLMYTILDQQCKINNKYCDQALEYKEYLAHPLLKIEGS